MAIQLSLWSILLCSIWVLGTAAQNYSIASFVANGSGCPPGTVTGSTEPNGRALNLRYNSREFTAAVSPSTDGSDSRKNCQATVTVNVPEGYQFAFNRFTYNGGYSIQAGARATYETLYYFQGTLPEGQGSGTIAGAAASNWQTLTHTVTPAVWSPCGESVIVGINSAIVASNGAYSTSGRISLNSLSIPASSFTWRAC